MLRFIVPMHPQSDAFPFHFNTSHVTVYHPHFTYLHQYHSYFNTSHVTVYRGFYVYIIKRKHISIHPMLRFIHSLGYDELDQVQFQYIPCYGLSYPCIHYTKGRMQFQYIPCYGLS